MWDAALYNKLSKERTQPSVDLVNRIVDRDFKRIIDVGCGTGLSTYPLRKHWPNAEIIGVDLSVEMLDEAKRMMNSVTWLQRDCGKPLDGLGTFDLVFSNAFLQWLNNQEEFLKNTHELLSENGVFAVQLPDFKSMPASDCINKAAAAWATEFIGIDNKLYFNHAIGEYYDILKRYYSKAEVWRISYFHVMENHEAIMEFIKGTALRPFIKRLETGQVDLFLQKILCELKDCYPVQEDGNVLFEFKRMFFLAEK